MTGPGAYAVEAELLLPAGPDPAGAVGAAVTVELCGHWEHEGACRWPHNSAIEPGRFRHVWHEQVDPASTSAGSDTLPRRRPGIAPGTPV